MNESDRTDPNATDRALGAYVKLMRAAESVSARIHRHLDAHRLTASQFGVLEALYHLGPLCQRDLARKLLRSPGNITLVIDNLERAGSVTRSRDAQDRRYITVHLTAEGRALMEWLFPAHSERIVAAMAALSPVEQETLGRLCRKLGKGQL